MNNEALGSVAERIVVMIQQHPEVNSAVSVSTNFREELWVDSLIIAELAIDIEEAFGLEPFSDEDFAKIQTVADVVSIVERSLGWLICLDNLAIR